MALSPEEVLQNNLNPFLSGIGEYGRRLASEQKLADERKYAQQIRDDARQYEEQVHQKRRGEIKSDTDESKDKDYARHLKEQAEILGVDVGGKSTLQIASEIEKAATKKKLDDEEASLKVRGKARAEETQAANDQAVRNKARELGIKDFDKADIASLLAQMPEAETKKLISSENTRNSALDTEAANPDNQKIVQEYDTKAKELARRAAGYYTASAQAQNQLSPEEDKQANAASFANVEGDPIFRKFFKSLDSAAKSDPQTAAALQRLRNGTPTQQDRKLIADPQIGAAMIQQHALAAGAFLDRHVKEDRNNSYLERQQDSEFIRALTADLKAMQSKHSFLSGRQMLNLDGLRESQAKPNLNQSGGQGAAPGLPPSTFQPQGQNPTNGAPALGQPQSSNSVQGLFPAAMDYLRQAPQGLPDAPLLSEGYGNVRDSVSGLATSLGDMGQSVKAGLFGGQLPPQRQSVGNPLQLPVGLGQMALSPLQAVGNAAGTLANGLTLSNPGDVAAPTAQDIEAYRMMLAGRR